MVAWLNEIVYIAAEEASLADVPDEVVTRAQGIFCPPERRTWAERLEPLIANLVLEIRPEWQVAGVRSGAVGSGRLLYRAGDYAVDLRLEPLGPEGSDIVGQIESEREPKDNLEGVVVQVVASGRTLGETETNEFGEFMIERPEDGKAVLRIVLSHCGHRIDLPLQN